MTRQLTTLRDAEDFLLRYSPPKMTGESYTLNRMQTLMARLGDPQNELNVIHIAGTSGKTSTAYFIRALLEQAGKKTGLTASPHVVNITERVQVNGEPLSEEVFLTYLNKFLELIGQWPELEPTYFELLVAFAYWVFWKEEVDYAVIETGLGGLLDATNVVTRADKICVLTPIGLDHTQILGDTIEAIATQKAGIIQRGNRIFSAEQAPGVAAVFQDTARRQSAPIEIVATATDETSLGLPVFQQQNWQLARVVVKYLRQRDDLASLSHEQLQVAAESMPPGRFEQYRVGETTVILDGAHNPQKLRALLRSLPTTAQEDATWLVAMAEAPEQKLADSVRVIATVAKRAICTEFQVGQDLKGRRSFRAHAVAEKMRHYGVRSDAEPEAALALEQALGQKPAALVITGSLFLVAQLRPRLLRLARRPSYRPLAK